MSTIAENTFVILDDNKDPHLIHYALYENAHWVLMRLDLERVTSTIGPGYASFVEAKRAYESGRIQWEPRYQPASDPYSPWYDPE